MSNPNAPSQSQNDARYIQPDAVDAKIAASGAIFTSTVTAKGDLVAATGSGTITRLPAGSNGQVLASDSTQASGLKWAVGGAVVETVTAPKADGNATVGVATTAAASDHVHPRRFFEPQDHSLITWNYDPSSAANSSIPSTGQLQMVRLHVPIATTISNIYLGITTLGSSLTPGQSFAALYTSSLALLGTTADQSSSWSSSIGLKTMALTSPVPVIAGDYYVGFWSTGTTAPAFCRGVSSPIVNVGLSSGYRYAISNGGLTTTAPATANALAASNSSFWIALS